MITEHSNIEHDHIYVVNRTSGTYHLVRRATRTRAAELLAFGPPQVSRYEYNVRACLCGVAPYRYHNDIAFQLDKKRLCKSCLKIFTKLYAARFQ